MVNVSGIRIDFNGFVSVYGEPIRLKYYNKAYQPNQYSSYDDDITLTQSGTDYWVSGLPQPLSTKAYSKEAYLIEQGFLKQTDTKLYLAGNVDVSGIVKVGIGSPTPTEFSIIPEGVEAPEINSEIVYKRVFLRQLTNGSFVGEY